MEQLTAIRQVKAERRAARKTAQIATAPKLFEQRISRADAIRARGMSIRLDE
jgi:hypothetical protein